MIEIKVGKRILNKSTKRADLQKTNTFSFTENGKLYGILAEELLLAKYPEFILKNTKHYDLELDGFKFDVKAKTCKGPPLPNYTASVSDYQKLHLTDFYIFFRIQKDLSIAWELGVIKKQEFYDRATYVGVGERDGPFVCRIAMWSIQIDKLIPIPQFLKTLK